MLLQPTNFKSFTPVQTIKTSFGVAAHPNQYVQQILSHYQNIDRQNLDSVLPFFAKDAIYEREGWPAFKGYSAIEYFHKHQRKLIGQHQVDLNSIQLNTLPKQPVLPIKGPSVLLSGLFEGTHRDNPVKLRYQDYWVFDPKGSGKVIYRKSWISTPGV